MQNELCQLGREVQRGGQGHSQQCKRQRRREGGRDTVEWGRLWSRDQARVQRAVEAMEVGITHPPLDVRGIQLSPGWMGTARGQGCITPAQPWHLSIRVSPWSGPSNKTSLRWAENMLTQEIVNDICVCTQFQGLSAQKLYSQAWTSL